MKLTFKEAKCMMDMDGSAWLMIKADRKEAMQFCNGKKEGKTYVADLKEFRKKRSNDANAFAWALLGELSAVLRIPPQEIYREYIPYVGGNYEIIPIREDAIEEWDRNWCKGHIGRVTEDMGKCKNIQGYHNIKTYIGSSDYDTSQMSRLLDLIIQDCKENDIEVMTEEQRSLLLSEWESTRR